MAGNTSQRAMAATERQAEACRLRRDGMTYPEIGAALGGISEKSARQLVQRGMRAVIAEPAQELIEREAEHLRYLRTKALEILRRDHFAVSFGKLATFEDGTPVLDDAPNLRAIAELVRISESLRKLLGADAPTRHRIEVVPEDAVDAEIRRVAAEAGLAGAEVIDIAEIERWLQRRSAAGEASPASASSD